MTFNILGIGTAVPEHTMSLDEAVAMSTELICRDDREVRLMRTMLRRARVRMRHTCVPHRIAYQWVGEGATPSSSPGPTTRERMELYATHAAPLAVLSATRAISDSGVRADQISHLVTVSCTGFSAPGFDVALMERLELAPTVERLHIGYMGCHGAINALRAARGLTAANPDEFVLVCATELCSLHYRFQWDEGRILGNALFGDGSAAIVGGPVEGEPDRPLRGRVVATGSCLIPNSREALTWNIGDHGFEMTLTSQVPQLISAYLEPWISAWLTKQGHSRASIASWAVHPGGPKILEAVEESLGLGGDDLSTSRDVLAEHGNMSSPTVLFILDRMLARSPPPLPCVALGFGPGMVAEAALIA